MQHTIEHPDKNTRQKLTEGSVSMELSFVSVWLLLLIVALGFFILMAGKSGVKALRFIGTVLFFLVWLYI